jgi:hypothetical protein
MPSTLAREVARLKARRPSRLRAVPRDRVAFARMLGIEPDDWQADFLTSDATRVLMNCSRQSGKSTVAAIRALHEALTMPGSLTLILAPAERQAIELFAKVSRLHYEAGLGLALDSDRKTGAALSNGSRIEALPGSSERTIRGFSGVSLLIVDEGARVLDELYYALRPMLAVSGGALMMLSTPAGKRGVFYEAWIGSEPWERYEVPAYMCPRIPAEFLEEERRSLPERVFRQEYMCSFEEAEGQVFSEASIQGAITEEVEPLVFDFEEEKAS